jgi:transketolase
MVNAPVILVGMVPGVLSDGNGPTHQAIEDVSIMRGLPNMGVFCPCDEREFVDGMRVLLDSGHPWYVRYLNTPDLQIDQKPFEPGKAITLRGASLHHANVTILTYGFLTHQCIEAADALRDDDMHVRVVHMRTLKPVDSEAILSAARSSELVVTVEDHFLTGGLSSIVAETLMQYGQSVPVLSIGLPTWFAPGRLTEVLEAARLNSDAIAYRIRERFADIVHHSPFTTHKGKSCITQRIRQFKDRWICCSAPNDVSQHKLKHLRKDRDNMSVVWPQCTPVAAREHISGMLMITDISTTQWQLVR